MKKILMSVAVGMFMLSGISLVLLTIEDKKDLSGRAYEVTNSEYGKMLAELQNNKKNNEWIGRLEGVGAFQINLNPDVWEALDLQNMVFYNRTGRMTMQVVPKNADLLSILGNNYTDLLSNGEDVIGTWTGSIFETTFVGKPRTVQLWSDPEKNWKVVMISQEKADQNMAVEALGGIVPTTENEQNVKGETVTDDSSKLATISRPSVVMIMTKYCTMFRVSQNDPDPVIAGKVYPFCLASTGSGFFVNPDGYIATNGHVVKMTDTTTVIYSAILTGGLDNFMIDALASAVRSLGVEPDMGKVATEVNKIKLDKQSAIQMALTIDKLVKDSLASLDTGKYNYYAQTGNTALKTNSTGTVMTGNGIVEASFVGADYEPMDSQGNFRSSDVALLKVSGKGYPALPIGDANNLTAGAGLEVIGFPGVAMGGQGSFLDASSNSEPTITRGVVSAIKAAKGDMKKLIQTDASITHGNSGGPALNNAGEVVGIATYGLTADNTNGNYNFLRDIGDLKALAAKNNVELKTGQTYNKWKEGLKNYWLSYYKYAKSDFADVVSEYPDHPTADNFVKQVATKVGTAADLTPMFTKGQRSGMMVAAGVVMALSLLTMIGTAMSGAFTKKAAVVYSQPPINPVVAETQPSQNATNPPTTDQTEGNLS